MAIIKYRDPLSVWDNVFSPKFPSLFDEDWLDSRSNGKGLEVTETAKQIKVKVPVYGVDPEDVDISVHDGLLTIKGSAKQEQKDKDEKTLHSRFETEFFYQTSLPREVNEDAAQATIKNGVVTIIMPKSEGRKGKKIKVTKE